MTPVTYGSRVAMESQTCAGVRLVLRRMSFGRRLELTKRVQELAKKLAFVAASPGAASDVEQALLGAEIDQEYLHWGLASIEGLEIDGEAATVASLIEAGPEALVREALQAVRREAGLSETERKNCESRSTSSSEAGPDGTATNAAA